MPAAANRWPDQKLLPMLSKDLRQLGRILIPFALVAWGLFALLFSGHLEDVPAPIWWLGMVFALAIGLAGVAALWFRARARSNQRW
jgi:hypothetical protein